MAEHDDMTNRELATALAGLAPRRSSINREHLLYLAGRAAAESEHRRRRVFSRAMTAAGWLAAAMSLGLWSAQPERLVESKSTSPTPATTIAGPANLPQQVPESVSPAVPEGPVVAQRDSQPPAGRSRESSRRPPGDWLATATELEQISRAGRLVLNRPLDRANVIVNEDDASTRPVTYRELMREWSNRNDLL